uniref:Polyglutamine-binding protein 1 n=1 Tax=Ananas comosus var. bracteatus TaxID=296719 RepID=A0A6V7PSD0_ANACO|nr:unnamed protein product [Ananas comosus var. bracteatus]
MTFCRKARAALVCHLHKTSQPSQTVPRHNFANWQRPRIERKHEKGSCKLAQTTSILLITKVGLQAKGTRLDLVGHGRCLNCRQVGIGVAVPMPVADLGMCPVGFHAVAWQICIHCNVEIGNGYGVPGGGAYYSSVPLTVQSKNVHEEKTAKEIPDYLKQRLKARGILKDEKAVSNCPAADNKSDNDHTTNVRKLPPGWVEAMDPASGSSYYYDWEEAIDALTGVKYYYNTKTLATQWEPPHATAQVISSNALSNTAQREANVTVYLEQTHLKRCLGCGGWGLGLVQSWGYCNHCTRYLVF